MCGSAAAVESSPPAESLEIKDSRELSALLVRKLLSEKDAMTLSKSLASMLQTPSSRMLDVSRVGTQVDAVGPRPAMRWLSILLYPLLNGTKSAADFFPVTVPTAIWSAEAEEQAAQRLFASLWRTSHARRLLDEAAEAAPLSSLSSGSAGPAVAVLLGEKSGGGGPDSAAACGQGTGLGKGLGHKLSARKLKMARAANPAYPLFASHDR